MSEARHPADTLPPFGTADILRWCLATLVTGLVFAAGIVWLWRQDAGTVGSVSAAPVMVVELVAEALTEAPAPEAGPVPEPEPAPEPEPEPQPVEPDPIPDPEPAPTPESDPEPLPDIPTPLPESSVAMPVMPSADLMASRASTPPTLRLPAAPQRATPAATPTAPSGSEQRVPAVSPADEQAWQGRVVAHLYRFRDYPAEAQRRRTEGVVTLRFAIDPAGRVLSSEIARSSGHDLLDGAVRTMISRASPVPTPPDGLAAGKRTLVVPIEFKLR